MNPWIPSPELQKQGIMTYIYKPSTLEGEPEDQKFKVILSYLSTTWRTRDPFFKINNPETYVLLQLIYTLARHGRPCL